MDQSKNIGFSLVMMVVTALVIVGVMQAMNSLIKVDVAGVSGADVLERIKPVGQLNTGAPIAPQSAPAATAAAAADTSAAARSGDQVFNASCAMCHGTGVAGAPKLGDKAAWAPRIQQGMETLAKHAINGFTGKTGVMPPRGTCGNCSDEELTSAVEYMVSQSK